MTQVSSLDYLSDLEQHGIKLGLKKIELLCEALGHPERSFASVVIAGTNGKGSVAAMLETGLRSAGLRTGRFTSPHLRSLEERFVVGGECVSRPELADLAGELRSAVERLQRAGRIEEPPTFFEATTALAFLLFRRHQAEVAVLEVGMGGRFDATNVVTPVAVAITSIDLDHQQFLGETLAAIAFEKAGVIKPGTLVVTGESKPAAVEVIERTCRERGARLVRAGEGAQTQVTMRHGLIELELAGPRTSYGPIALSLRGRHQVANAIIAVRLLEELELALPIPRSAIEAAVTQTHWPGRLELVTAADGRQVLLDAAHNVAAAEALGRYLHEVYPQGIPLVLAALRDKDLSGIVRALRPYVTHVVCTSVDSRRALSADEVAEVVAAAGPDIPRAVCESPADALRTAWSHSDVICAAGSIYLVGELTGLLASADDTSREAAQIPG